MLIIPAIDLYKGEVVRLIKGDIDKIKIYSRDPVSTVNRFKKFGVEFFHIVDLSNALGEGDNFNIIKKIIEKTNIKAQVGGGIRDLEKAKRLISIGVKRIVISTKALDENFLRRILKILGKERIAIGIDAYKDFLVVKGWKEKTKVNVWDFIDKIKKIGIKWIIYTDVLRDGTLKGVNLNNLKKLYKFKDLNIIFSGGISSLEDIKKIEENALFLKGIILGKALYEKKIDLSKILPLK